MELRIRKEKKPLKAVGTRLCGQIANANSPETKRDPSRNETDTQGAHCPHSIGRKVSRLKSPSSYLLKFQEIESHQRRTVHTIGNLPTMM
ncbi:TPA: hypothetical protein ACNV5P_004375 [Enterobacter asburiae]